MIDIIDSSERGTLEMELRVNEKKEVMCYHSQEDDIG